MKPITPDRFQLTGVPPVGFWGNPQKADPLPRCPEDIPIPSVFRAVMEYLGEDLGCQNAGIAGRSGEGPLACGYAHMMGVSGAAWYSQWHEGWNADHLALVYMAQDFETPERRILNALGYSYQWHEARPGPGLQDEWMALIFDSLYNRHVPVISYGIVGPPEAAIITGWDEGGEVLTGWSYFQSYPWNPGPGGADDYEPGGQFRKRAWTENNLCLLVIGEKASTPPIGETDRPALEWALEVMRQPVVWPFDTAPDWWGRRWNGIAAIEAWRAALLDDANWAEISDADLNDRYWRHNDKAFIMAEELSLGGVYLRQVGARHPGAQAELVRAGELLQGCHDMAFKMHHVLAGPDGKDELPRLREAGTRRRIAEVVEEFQANYTQTAGLIEQALAKLN